MNEIVMWMLITHAAWLLMLVLVILHFRREIKRLTVVRSCDARALPAPSCATQDERTAGHMKDLAAEINEINRANGWHVLTPDDWPDVIEPGSREAYKIPAVLALIHSEVSEALEGFRKGDRENVAEEMADVLIRVLDATGGLGIDIDAEVRKKLAKNRERGLRHGGKTL